MLAQSDVEMQVVFTHPLFYIILKISNFIPIFSHARSHMYVAFTV